MDPFLVMTLLNAGIAVAYWTIAIYIAPRLKVIPPVARIFGVLFFIACAFTHTDLAIHAALHSSHWLIEAHMFIIHGVQFVVDWGFIIVSAPWLRLIRRIDSEVERAHEQQEMATHP